MQEQPVLMESWSVRDTLAKDLQIPQYQRAYIWRMATVESFLSDISSWMSKSGNNGRQYHLGTIILRERESDGRTVLEIVDGQQRLVTLALLANELKVDIDANKLLEKPLRGGAEAVKRAQVCCRRCCIHDQSVLGRLIFSVLLVTKSADNDIAYSFFDNSNTLGKKLSDYDLLKTHHLRFVESRNQGDCARRWNALAMKVQGESSMQHDLLNDCIYRLRNWSAYGGGFDINGDLSQSHDLYTHFSSVVEDGRTSVFETAAPLEIEQLIIGGEPFFRYVETYRDQFVKFLEMESVGRLREKLKPHSGGVICKVVLAIGFAAFCRFGSGCLEEVIASLAYVVSRLRLQGSVQERMIAWRSSSIGVEGGWGGFLGRVVRVVLHAPSDMQLVRILSGSSFEYEAGKCKENSVSYRYWNALREYLAESRSAVVKEILSPRIRLDELCA